MRRCDIGCFVDPHRPDAERNLASYQRDPEDRQSLQRSKPRRISPDAKTKVNYRYSDAEPEKAVPHLQSNLKCSHIRQSPGGAPRVHLCECSCACVRYPGPVRRWKIENRQIAMLVAHRGSETKLHVNRDRDRDHKRCKWG